MSKYNIKQRKEINELILKIAKQQIIIKRPINNSEIAKELQKHGVNLTRAYIGLFLKEHKIR